MTVPLILLAIPSVYTGWQYIEPMLFGEHFGRAIVVRPEHDVLARLHEHFHGAFAFVLHGVTAAPFWLAVSGIGVAFFLYRVRTDLPQKISERFRPVYNILVRKYGFDELYQWLFAGGARGVGGGLWQVGDVTVIDGFFVNGTAHVVRMASAVIRHLQSGYIYHYAFGMIIGVFVLLTLWLSRL